MTIPQIPDYTLPTIHDLPMNKVNWLFEPDHAALLIHDMQNYFLNFWQKDSVTLSSVIDNILALRRFSKQLNIPVYYTAQPAIQSDEKRGLLNDMWGAGLTKSPEQQRIIDALKPDMNDTVLTKWRYSAFHHSPLENLLKESHRNQLIITGVYAHIGCMATATDAFMRDIKPFFVADALADFSQQQHFMSLNYIAGSVGRVVMTDTLLPTTQSKSALRRYVFSLISEPEKPLDDDNLIDYGLDSVQIMSLVARWRVVRSGIDFVKLAKNPSIDGWWELLSDDAS